MRRVRPDVSHRIRRQPSIFSVRWFRIALGAGVALVLALLVGPSVASWFGSDLPGSLFLLVPWSSAEKTAGVRSPEPITPRPSVTSPGPASSGPARGAAASAAKGPGASGEGQSGTGGRLGAGGSTTAPPPTATVPVVPSPRETARTTPPATAAPGRSESLTAPPAVYWVQVGAFLDHRNADRLVERLRGEGMSAATTSFEQSRVLYRVLLAAAEGGRVTDDAIERVRGLGHPVETTAEGPAVTGLVPLRRAVETSHSLRQQGVPVRLKQEVSSATYRVVRVGSFATAAEAEAALAVLNARGVEGVVVRER
jgi:cell division septation protein DedD